VLAGHLNLAICCLKLGRHRQARDACDAALQLEPSNIKALYRHGLVSRLPYMKSTIPLNHWLSSRVVSMWTQVQTAWVQITATTLSGNSLSQTVHTHCASVHQAAKLVATLLGVAGVTAGLAESNGSLPPGL